MSITNYINRQILTSAHISTQIQARRRNPNVDLLHINIACIFGTVVATMVLETAGYYLVVRSEGVSADGPTRSPNLTYILQQVS